MQLRNTNDINIMNCFLFVIFSSLKCINKNIYPNLIPVVKLAHVQQSTG
uniref:Uncharacterized protein n=1 Tax=Nelumbo nucifera TaxID=4432 RepID=A0A822ZRG2_NELNU|nr:TPA_asm: hypothetical protein HUJ06_004331 [Nelumbo nucifera]